MECIPAIDLRGGKAVRLIQGDYDQETSFGDAMEIANRLVKSGAKRVHLVDLDAALTGNGLNRSLALDIVRCLSSYGVASQLGGGVRTAEVARGLVGAGVDRVVLGTVAVEDPQMAIDLAHEMPGRIAIGLDHRKDEMGRQMVAVRGWTKGSGLELSQAIACFEGAPFGALIITDIARDGMMMGPDIDGYSKVLAMTSLPVVASGGVSGLSDLRALSSIEVNGRALSGAIVGKAILGGTVTLEDAVMACER